MVSGFYLFCIHSNVNIKWILNRGAGICIKYRATPRQLVNASPLTYTMTSITTSYQAIHLNTQYGSPADFATAIMEIQAALPSEAVSIDPAVLTVHSQLADGSKSKHSL
jgi:hypothetical protein